MKVEMEAGAGSRKKYPSQVPRASQAKLNDFLTQQRLTLLSEKPHNRPAVGSRAANTNALSNVDIPS